MSESEVNFHAYIPDRLSEDEVDAAHDAAAAAVGLTLHHSRRDKYGLTREYGNGGAETLPFAYTLQPPCQLAMFGLWRSRAGNFAPVAVAEMFTQICVALEAHLARTDQGSGIGLVQPSELTGALEFLDWFQYLGPRVVERIGRERLITVPLMHVEERGPGIVMRLNDDPFVYEEPKWRQRVAEHIGITLRPRR